MEGVERIGGDAERSVFEFHSRQPPLIHRLHDDTGCDAEPLLLRRGEMPVNTRALDGLRLYQGTYDRER